MIIRKCDRCGHTYSDAEIGGGEIHYSLHCVTTMGYRAVDLCSTECLREYLAEQLPLSFSDRPER